MTANDCRTCRHYQLIRREERVWDAQAVTGVLRLWVEEDCRFRLRRDRIACLYWQAKEEE